ncbi:MAG TPA: cytochrome P450 [Streptosporangiaceae bacterium]|nr:cytochrome P450 [Streptosporangiaceae bacterium]
MPGPQIPEGFDVTDPDLYAHRVPNDELAELRRAAPIWWNSQPDSGFDDDGFWVVSKHADIMEISRNSDLFGSWENTAIIRHGGDIKDSIDLQRLILLNIDPPHHTKLRQIVSRGFTPRSINGLRDKLTERAERIVAAALRSGTGDFVTDVACELPLQAIADLIGVPLEDRKKIFEWSNTMVGYDDPEFGDAGQIAAAELVGYAMVMAEDRKQTPRDDIVTKLVNAQIDGGQLSSDEFGYFVILMSVAGNETTRNAISHGMLAYFDHPDQWELFCAERPATAADEVVRWATPVTAFQRTAKADTEIGGQEIRRGDRLGLIYRSANFDEDVFDAPERFDIMRSPNPHLGFGGTGAHYCIGVNLAKLEIDLIFNAIADAMPNIRQAGDAERLRSGWLNGIKRLPVSYG